MTNAMFLPIQLRDELLSLFRKHGLSVGVGFSSAGISIRSQDPRLDALNIGELKTFGAATEADTESTSDVEVQQDDTGLEPRTDSEDATSDSEPDLGPFDSFGGRVV